VEALIVSTEILTARWLVIVVAAVLAACAGYAARRGVSLVLGALRRDDDPSASLELVRGIRGGVLALAISALAGGILFTQAWLVVFGVVFLAEERYETSVVALAPRPAWSHTLSATTGGPCRRGSRTAVGPGDRSDPGGRAGRAGLVGAQVSGTRPRGCSSRLRVACDRLFLVGREDQDRDVGGRRRDGPALRSRRGVGPPRSRGASRQRGLGSRSARTAAEEPGR
jgi:hypothetical protein